MISTTKRKLCFGTVQCPRPELATDLDNCFFVLCLQNMVLHYQSDGGIMMSINFKKELFFIPLVFILKARVLCQSMFLHYEVD